MSLRLFKMIAEGEHQKQDFKYCINDSRKNCAVNGRILQCRRRPFIAGDQG